MDLPLPQHAHNPSEGRKMSRANENAKRLSATFASSSATTVYGQGGRLSSVGNVSASSSRPVEPESANGAPFLPKKVTRPPPVASPTVASSLDKEAMDRKIAAKYDPNKYLTVTSGVRKSGADFAISAPFQVKKIPKKEEQEKYDHETRDLFRVFSNPNANAFTRRVSRIVDNYWFSEGTKAIFIAVYITINAILWIFQFFKYLLDPATPNVCVPVARGFGMVLNFNCALILVPVLRNLLSFLRNTAIAQLLPLDKNIIFHRRIAGVIAIAAFGHAAAHWCNYTLALQSGQDGLLLAFYTLAGASGHLLSLIMFIMYPLAMAKVRRIYFEVFYYAHHMLVPFFALLLVHAPNFFLWVAVPGIAYILERTLRYIRSRQRVQVLKIHALPSGVYYLEMHKSKFRYKAGQYLFLNCPYLSVNEWHPFTITSAPEDDILSVHIKEVGDFTKGLSELLNPSKKEHLVINKSEGPDGTPLLRVDGPFGSASEEVFDYRVTVMVGGGIGVTPFASILKSIRYRFKGVNASIGRLEKLYFIWVSRDASAYEWFEALLVEMDQDPALKDLLDISLYFTGGKKKGDESNNRATVRNISYKRPAWSALFQGWKAVHPLETVGVFFCGPKVLSKALYRLCRDNTDPQGTRFLYSKENF